MSCRIIFKIDQKTFYCFLRLISGMDSIVKPEAPIRQNHTIRSAPSPVCGLSVSVGSSSGAGGASGVVHIPPENLQRFQIRDQIRRRLRTIPCVIKRLRIGFEDRMVKRRDICPRIAQRCGERQECSSSFGRACKTFKSHPLPIAGIQIIAVCCHGSACSR